MMVDALFIDPSGPYPGLLGVEHCWDEKRDARNYLGPGPVVAHPPCQLWVNMAAVNWKRYGRQLPAWYPGGDDGGCFRRAVDFVREYGGVLEHPAGSHAWGMVGAPYVSQNQWAWDHAAHDSDKVEAWCEVWQSAYGHPARKRTWLYYCGNKVPFELDWTREPGTHQVGWFDRNKPTLSKKMASRTPLKFAQTLIALAEHSR